MKLHRYEPWELHNKMHCNFCFRIEQLQYRIGWVALRRLLGGRWW
jgi:hypothetical protein